MTNMAEAKILRRTLGRNFYDDIRYDFSQIENIFYDAFTSKLRIFQVLNAFRKIVQNFEETS